MERDHFQNLELMYTKTIGHKKYRGEASYTSLDGYFEVHEERGDNIEELKRVYEYWKSTHK